MSDLGFYKSQPDYEDIKEFLNLDPVAETIDQATYTPAKENAPPAIIVENIPAVDGDKVEKLRGVLHKIYVKVAASVQLSDIDIPLDPAGKSYGFCFVKFKTVTEAEDACKSTNNFAIDKKHVFKVRMYGDMEQFLSIPDEFVPPAPIQFFPRPDTTSWICDHQCRDQFVVRYATETGIYWANTSGEQPTLVYGGEREKVDGRKWCESRVRWSPQGSYLATFHTQGIRLWGSDGFISLGRLSHALVDDIAFSPCERYIVTYRRSGYAPKGDESKPIIVWDLSTCTVLRTFDLKNPLDVKFHVKATITEEKAGKRTERVVRGRVKAYDEDSDNAGFFTIEEGSTVHERVPLDKVQFVQEPNVLKWSHDGNYLARLGADIITVYQLPAMTILDQSSLVAKDAGDFSWSPSSNLIAYWTPSAGNQGNLPAYINAISIPDRTVKVSSSVFGDLSEGQMFWQSEGDYLCVQMTKVEQQKKKKSTKYILMFFNLRASPVSREQIVLDLPILNVRWEPAGERIVVIHGEGRSFTTSFYSMHSTPKSAGQNTKRELAVTPLITKVGAWGDAFWSPNGGIIALAQFASDCCIFELYDVDENLTIASRKHDRSTRLAWDPSGRFLASYTAIDLRNSAARAQLDDGIIIYTFQGAVSLQFKRERLYQFEWRPRPKDLLTPKEKKDVIKNMRHVVAEIEREERMRRQEYQRELESVRIKEAENFFAFLNRNKEINRRLRPRRVEIRNGYDSDDERNYRIETIREEVVLSSKEQLIQ